MNGVPKVRLEVNSDRFTYKVVTADNWPIPATDYRELYLDAAAAKLSQERPNKAAATTVAPLPIGDNSNRAIFDFAFDKDRDIIGHMALKLYVEEVDAEDIDLFVGVG
jgi:hypothetical protein